MDFLHNLIIIRVNQIEFKLITDQNGISSDPDTLIIRALSGINLDGCSLFYHGTNWREGIGIMRKLKIIPRSTTTDFGLKNFYLTDIFRTSKDWANRSNQPAIYIFAIPNSYIENSHNHIKFQYNYDWKKFVFKIRNPPEYGEDLEEKITEYENFIDEIDSNDLISGPIMKNPGSININDVRSIVYGKQTPYQYAFKESTISDLNNMLAVTIFFYTPNF